MTSSGIINTAIGDIWGRPSSRIFLFCSSLMQHRYAPVIKKIQCILCMCMKVSTNEIMHGETNNSQKLFLRVKIKTQWPCYGLY